MTPGSEGAGAGSGSGGPDGVLGSWGPSPVPTCGIVLAAGAGTRYGHPKALAREPGASGERGEHGRSGGMPWIELIAGVLACAGCRPVLVALGAAREDASRLVPASARIVPVAGWAEGLGASVRAALTAAGETGAEAALVVPVDVPELPASVCERLLREAAPGALVRAVYRGEPGHPVLLGRDHWPGVIGAASGDRGAGPYLRAYAAREAECSDLWHGGDVDRPR